MAYGYRRRFSRRPRRRVFKIRSRRTRPSTKRAKRLIKRVCRSQLETKFIGKTWARETDIHYGGLNNALPTAESRSGLLLKQVTELYPVIQGTSITERIGNAIQPVSLRFKMQLCARPFDPDTNNMWGPFDIHMVIYSAKSGNSLGADGSLDPSYIRLSPHGTNPHGVFVPGWSECQVASEQWSQMDHWNKARYNILKHKCWSFKAPSHSVDLQDRVGPTSVTAAAVMPFQQGLANPTIGSASLPCYRTYKFSLPLRKVWKFDPGYLQGQFPTNQSHVAIGFWIVPKYSGINSQKPNAQDKCACLSMEATLSYKDA